MPVTNKISRIEAVKKILDVKEEGIFFAVHFTKRSTGELRIMTCRGGVHKYTNGKGLAFEPSDKGLIGVWEANNKEGAKEAAAYRFISVEGIKELHTGGKVYIVE